MNSLPSKISISKTFCQWCSNVYNTTRRRFNFSNQNFPLPSLWTSKNEGPRVRAKEFKWENGTFAFERSVEESSTILNLGGIKSLQCSSLPYFGPIVRNKATNRANVPRIVTKQHRREICNMCNQQQSLNFKLSQTKFRSYILNEKSSKLHV